MSRRNVLVICGDRRWNLTAEDAEAQVKQGAMWRQNDGAPISPELLAECGGRTRCIEVLSHDERGQSGSGGTASINPCGGIPGHGTGHPSTVKLKDGTYLPLLRADGRPAMERSLDRLQMLATDRRKMRVMRQHVAKETAAGRFHRPPSRFSIPNDDPNLLSALRSRRGSPAR
jgi:hypothetical protein